MNDIKTLVKSSGMTQTAFAKRFGIPLRTLQHWIAGDRECPKYVIAMLSELLDK